MNGKRDSVAPMIQVRRLIAAVAAVVAIVMIDGALTSGPDSAVSLLVAGARTGGGPDAPEADCPPPSREPVRSGPHGTEAVALTLDDGPGPQTMDVVRALARHDARATFFVLGRQIPGRERTLERIAAAGHEIGNHSTSHDRMPGLVDLATASDLIERTTGRRPCVFRPPAGVTNQRLVRRARRLGMSTVLWDVDPEDWFVQDSDVIRERVMDAIRPGAIVLLHDAGGERGETAKAVGALVRTLSRRGLETVTVSELLAGSGGGSSHRAVGAE